MAMVMTMLCHGHGIVTSMVIRVVMTADAELTSFFQMQSHEVPQAVYLEKEPFTPENGLMTPTTKLCRHAIAKEYMHIISKMYDKADDVMETQLQSLLETLVLHTNAQDNTQDKPDSLGTQATAPGSQGKEGFNISLSAIGIDSLATVQFVTMIKQKLRVQIPLKYHYARTTPPSSAP